MKKYFKRWVITFRSDYNQFNLFSKVKWNWYSFNFLYIYFEYDQMTEGLEFCFYVLGLGVLIRYNLPASDAIFEEFKKEAEEAEEAEEVDWGTILSSQEEMNKYLDNKK